MSKLKGDQLPFAWAWGVASLPSGEVHVVPVDDWGHPMPPHLPAWDCPCHPDLIREPRDPFGEYYDHHEPERLQ